MPELKGTDFAELISKLNIHVIFTTAYSEYAIKGFELNALDYLVKPITFKRFLNAVEKFPVNENASLKQLVIKSGYDFHKVIVSDIIYIESDSEYVNYHLANGRKIMENQSLTKLMSILPDYFMRVHRSYIINKQKVTGLKARELQLTDITIPVSDSYYDIVKSTIFKS